MSNVDDDDDDREQKVFKYFHLLVIIQHMYFSRKNARKAGILLYIFSCSTRY